MIAPEVVTGETELVEFDDLSARALNLFKRFSLYTVDDLAAWLSQHCIPGRARVRGIGTKTQSELAQIVAWRAEMQQDRTRNVSMKDALAPFLDVSTIPQDARVAVVLEHLRQRLQLEVSRLYTIACEGESHHDSGV